MNGLARADEVRARGGGERGGAHSPVNPEKVEGARKSKTEAQGPRWGSHPEERRLDGWTWGWRVLRKQ